MGAKNKLTSLQVRNAAPGKYNDGDGLWLHTRKDDGAQWFLRFTIHGRRREMGLGSLSQVTLREARETADKWRKVVRDGKDPIKERERISREAQKSDTTITNITMLAFEAKRAELKGDGRNSRWLSPLENHVLPKLGKVPIEELDQRDIQTAISPIWHTKGETAKKAINRLGIVINHAAAMGLNVDVQAVAKAKQLLGRSRHVSKPTPAMAWMDVPAFYESLNNGTVTELALRFLILTANRSKPVRLAKWDQIDCDVWTAPAENMKGRKGEAKDFRVPLSVEALHVLESATLFDRDGYVFPGQRKGPISDMTMLGYMKDRGLFESLTQN